MERNSNRHRVTRIITQPRVQQFEKALHCTSRGGQQYQRQGYLTGDQYIVRFAAPHSPAILRVPTWITGPISTCPALSAGMSPNKIPVKSANPMVKHSTG